MIGSWEIPVLLVAAVLLFGAEKVPKLARSLGQAQKEFQAGQAEGAAEAPSRTSKIA